VLASFIINLSKSKIVLIYFKMLFSRKTLRVRVFEMRFAVS